MSREPKSLGQAEYPGDPGVGSTAKLLAGDVEGDDTRAAWLAEAPAGSRLDGCYQPPHTSPDGLIDTRPTTNPCTTSSGWDLYTQPGWCL